MGKDYDYYIATASGKSAEGAAQALSLVVNQKALEGFAPHVDGMGFYPTSLINRYPGIIEAGVCAYQTLIRIPAKGQEEKVTGGGLPGRDPVTPIIGELQLLERDSPDWVSAWAALAEEVTDIHITDYMYMSSKLDARGLAWEHAFKHIGTRKYQYVSTPRRQE